MQGRYYLTILLIEEVVYREEVGVKLGRDTAQRRDDNIGALGCQRWVHIRTQICALHKV